MLVLKVEVENQWSETNIELKRKASQRRGVVLKVQPECVREGIGWDGQVTGKFKLLTSFAISKVKIKSYGNHHHLLLRLESLVLKFLFTSKMV